MPFDRRDVSRDNAADTSPAKASWRRKGSARAAGAGHRDERSRHWQEGPRSSATRLFGRRFKLFLCGLLIAAGVGVLVWAVFRVPYETPIIAIALTEYVAPVPPNAHALEDILRLQEANANITVHTRGRQDRMDDPGRFLGWLRDRLHQVQPGGPANSVVLYLSAHGVVDDSNRPCLLLENARPRDSAEWLPVAAVLDVVKSHLKARSSLLDLIRGREKVLLVLDASRTDANWSLGQLDNVFADRLRDAVANAGIPRELVVLNSTGPGQIGWTSPCFRGRVPGGSAFGCFLAEGLRGHADTDNDKEISLRELCDYVSARVATWVGVNRSAEQRPMMLAAGANDYPVFYVDTAALAGDPGPVYQTTADPEFVDRKKEVLDCWSKHAALCAAAPHRFDPLGWAVLEHQLVRFEQLLLAGTAYENQFRETRAQIDSLCQRVHGACSPNRKNPAVGTIPLCERLCGFPDGETPEERKKAFDKWRADAKTASTRAAPSLEYLSAAAGGWKWLTERPAPAPGGEPQGVRRQDIQTVLDFVPARTTDPPHVVEIEFLRMLYTYLDWQGELSEADVARAVQTRDLAERAATPADERVHYWVRKPVDEADPKRRAAEDLLFVGNARALQEARTLWGSASGFDGVVPQGFRAAESIAERVGAAYRLRDRAWANVPYLVQWALHRKQRLDSAKLDDRLPAVDALVRLIEGTHELGEAIDDGLDDGTWNADPTPGKSPLTAYDSLNDHLTALDRAFQERIAHHVTLAESGLRAGDWREVDELLQVPLLTGRDRQALLEGYLAFMDQNDRVGPVDAAAAKAVAASRSDGTGSPDASRVNDLSTATAAGVHPAVAILSRGQMPNLGGGKTSDRHAQIELLTAQGALVRALLAGGLVRSQSGAMDPVDSLSQFVRTRMQQTETAIKSAPATEPALARRGLSEADRRARAAAVLLAVGLEEKEIAPDGQHRALDPTGALRRFDLHSEVLWLCQRTLDDFWGPPPQPETADSSASAAYFHVASQNCLAAARTLAVDWGNDAYGMAGLETLLEKRTQAAKGGVRLESRDVVLGEVEVKAVDDNLPRGTAAVYVERLNGSDDGTSSLPADAARRAPPTRELPVGEAHSLVCPLPAVAGDREAHDFRVTALYRGHLWRRPVPALRDTIDIVYKPTTLKTAKVTVAATEAKPGRIVFILDCSGTMSKSDPQRLPEAKRGLLALLDELPNGSCRVGLMFYGHRARWKDRFGGTVLHRIHGLTQGIHPAADAEWAEAPLRLDEAGLLDEVVHDRIQGALETVQPWGQTPLYFSLMEALNAYQAIEVDRDEPRHVVLITDGEEDAGSTAEGRNINGDVVRFASLAGVSSRDVWQRLEQLGGAVRIHVVALQLGNIPDLKKIADQSGGSYHNIEDLSKIRDALRESLGITQFVACRHDGSPGPDDWVALGKTCLVAAPGRYLVQLRHAADPRGEVVVEGGESLKLFFDKAAGRLFHKRYGDWGPGQPHEITKGPAFFIGAHVPEWEHDDDGVAFIVSVQNADPAEFSPRPRQVWAEITPLSVMPADNPEPMRTYFFCDRDFEPDRPVPVLRFRAPRWPRNDAPKAQLRLWIRNEPLRPEECAEFDVRRLANGTEFAAGFIDGVTFRVHRAQDRVVIAEEHAGPDLGSACVEMSHPSMVAVAVDRRYVPELRQIWHTFACDGQNENTESRIRITPSARIKDSAAAATLIVTLPWQ